jgi:5-methyltetrahydropteroyltriglutamate--homocysteine methyltransferase
VRTDIANLRAALDGVGVEEAFLTAISPSNLELYYENRYYPTDEAYLAALADAMHVEFKAIVDGGFLLQVDDPRMATHYNRTPDACSTPATAPISRRGCTISSCGTSST